MRHVLKKSLLKSPKSVWKASKQDVLLGKSPDDLPGAWKLLLLGDGSPTRHLQLLTGYEVEVQLIAMKIETNPSKEAPNEIADLKPPLIKRQVWLKCDQETLGWAESWWNQHEAEEHLIKKEQPIWSNLTKGRSELFREVDGLALVNSDWLEKGFGIQGPFWSRHYRFFRKGKELTVIREVFSPKLENWLGFTPRK